MRINTNIDALLSEKPPHRTLGSSIIHLEYTKDHPDETPEMKQLREEIVRKNQNNENVNPLIERHNELKEQLFVQKNGISSAEHAKQKEEEYRNLSVTERECLCLACMHSFNSDKAHPICEKCGNRSDSFAERNPDSQLVGKTIVSVYSNEESLYIFFSDNTYITQDISLR